MNKSLFLITIAILGCVCTIGAQESITELALQPLTAQKANVNYAPNGKTTLPKASEGTAPADIIGSKFMIFYDSFVNYGNSANWFEIEKADNDSVLLKNFASGYDLKAKYDAASGKLTIPTGKVIAQNADGVDIVIYNLLASSGYSSYNSSPVIATISGNEVTFADGFFGCTDTGLNYVRMYNIKSAVPNGSLKFSLVDGTTLEEKAGYEYPILATKTAANKVEIQGLASWLYHHNYYVPLTITESSNTAKLLTTDTIDFRIANNLKESYFMLYKDPTTSGLKSNPIFNIVNGDTTTITAQNLLFEGKRYLTGYTGWYLKPFEIKINFNLYEAPIANVDTVNGIYIQRIEKTHTAAVIGAAPETTEVNIPTEISYRGENYPVTTIAEKAFYNNTTITKLTIPSSITLIELYALGGMKSLNEVHLPDLKTWCGIEREAGYSAPFTNTLFSSTTKSKVYFEGIDEPNPSEIEIPAGVTSLRYAFYNARFLKKIKFGPDVKNAYYGFAMCTNLESVELNDGLEAIEYAFYLDAKLTSIEIPGSVTKINIYALSGCRKLTNIKLNEGTQAILSSSFQNCVALPELSLPSTLTSISANAFAGCAAITNMACSATTPPTVAADAVFSAFAANATLRVPAQSIDAYKSADGWKNFKAIEQYSGVANIEVEDSDIPAEYYTIHGSKVNENNLTPGIYIKKQGSKAKKIIVK